MSASGIRAGRAFVEIGADDAPLQAALARLRGRMQAFGASLAAVGGGLIGASAGVLGALAWPLRLAANLETTQAAFETMLKDAERARVLLESVARFAASTPFEFPELADATKKLLAFGSSAEAIEAELRTIGDIASGVGVPIAELAELYGKARVAGRLYAEDINQLTGRGIPVIGELARQFGVAESEVKGLVEAGKIGFPQLQRAFIDLTTGAGQFAGGMARQSQTLLGVLSTLRDQIAAAVRPLGQALLPVVGQIATATGTVVAVIGRFLDQNRQLALYAAGGALAVGALGAALVGVGGTLAFAGFAIQGLATLWGTFIGVLSASSAVATAVFGAIISPIGLLVISAGALLTAFGQWQTIFAGIRSVAAPVFNFLREQFAEIGSAFGEVGGIMRDTWAAVVQAVSSGNLSAAMEVVTAGASLAWEVMVAAMRSTWANWTNGFRDAWTDAITFFASIGVGAFFNLLSIWESVTAGISNAFDTVATYIVGTFDLIYTRLLQIGALWQSLWSDEGALAAEQAIIRLQEDFERRAATREQGNQSTNAQRSADADARRQALADQARAYIDTLTQLGEDEKRARREGNNAALVAAQQRLADAKAAFAAAQAEANKPPEKSEAEKKKEAAADEAANAGNVISGQFNATLAGQQLGLNNLRERTAKATERTAAATEKLAERAGEGLVFS